MHNHSTKEHKDHIIKDPVAKKQEVASETIQHTQEQAQEYLNSWKRTQADFENYRKEEVKRVAEILTFANQRMILDVADIIDNLEMVFKHAPPDTNPEWLKGAKQVFKQWEQFLGQHGAKRIEASEVFDPEKHEAVSGSGEQIIEQVRAGYEMNGKVIRPARVKTN